MFGKGDDDGGILSLTARNDAKRRAPLRVVEEYWQNLRVEGSVPARSAVDPRGMESALENAFLLEKIAPTLAKIRVAGSALSDLMGMQVAGMPLSTLIDVDDRDRFADGVRALFTEPAIVRLRFTGQEGFGRPRMTAHMILLPLRSDFGEVSRALGALVVEGRLGRAPRRLKLSGLEVERIAMADHTPATEAGRPAPARKVDPRPAGSFGAAAGAGRGAPNPGGGPRKDARAASELPARGHLRLVVSND